MWILRRALVTLAMVMSVGGLAGCVPSTATISVEAETWSGWNPDSSHVHEPVSATLKHGEWMTAPGFSGEDLIIHIEHIGGASVDITTSTLLVEVTDGAWGEAGTEFTVPFGETREFTSPTLDAGITYRITATHA